MDALFLLDPGTGSSLTWGIWHPTVGNDTCMEGTKSHIERRKVRKETFELGYFLQASENCSSFATDVQFIKSTTLCWSVWRSSLWNSNHCRNSRYHRNLDFHGSLHCADLDSYLSHLLWKSWRCSEYHQACSALVVVVPFVGRTGDRFCHGNFNLTAHLRKNACMVTIASGLPFELTYRSIRIWWKWKKSPWLMLRHVGVHWWLRGEVSFKNSLRLFRNKTTPLEDNHGKPLKPRTWSLGHHLLRTMTWNQREYLET